MDFLPQAYPLAYEVIGVAGFGLYVTNYTLLTFHKLHSHDALYFGINLVAATLVLVSLSSSFNLASAMIQGFWVVISSAAILIRLRRNWQAGPQKGPVLDTSNGCGPAVGEAQIKPPLILAPYKAGG